MDRGERRRRGWFKFQHRLKQDQNQHYNDTTCPCWVPGKGQARFKDTPCKRSYSRYEFTSGWEYDLPRDERRVLPEVCTTRNPARGSGKKYKRNVRQFAQHFACWKCGQTVIWLTPEDRKRFSYQTTLGFRYCTACKAKEAKKQALALSLASEGN